MKTVILHFLSNWLLTLTFALTLTFIILRIIEYLLAHFVCLLLLIKFKSKIQIKKVCFSLIWATIRLRDIKFCVQGIGEFYVKEIHISCLRKISSADGKIFSILVKGVVLTVPLSGAGFGINLKKFHKKLLLSIAANAIFKLDQVLINVEEKTQNYTLNSEFCLVGLLNNEVSTNPEATPILEENPCVNDSLIFKAIQVKISTAPIELGSIPSTVFEASVLKAQIYFGELPKYSIGSAGVRTYNVIPYIVVEIIVETHLILCVDIQSDLLYENYSEFITKLDEYLPNDQNLVLRVKMQSIKIQLGKNWTLTSYPESGFNYLEIAQVYRQDMPSVEILATVRIKEVEWYSCKEVLFKINSAKVYLRKKRRDDRISLYFDSVNTSRFYLCNIVNLLPLLNKLPISYCNTVIFNMEKAIFEFNQSIKLFTDRIEFKFKRNKLLLNSSNNSVSGSYTNPAVFFTERICIEAAFASLINNSAAKLQLITAPILLCNSQNYFLKNIQTNYQFREEISNLKTFNTLYVTCVQIRHHAFHNQEICYSNMSEIVIGDVFGSIDHHCACDLMKLLSELVQFLTSVKFNKFTYRSLKLKTSLTSLNLVNSISNVYEKEDKIIAGLVKLTLSPISFAECDFHAGAVALKFADLNLKIMCCLSPRYLNNNYLECGSVHLALVTLTKNKTNDSQDEKIEYLKQVDFTSRRLWFLYDTEVNRRCGCEGNSEFFSASFTDKESEIVCFKPCVYWMNKKYEYDVYGFGQSILVEKEMAMFSHKVFFQESKLSSQLNTVTKFDCLFNSELETTSTKTSQYCEPYEIGLYNSKLSLFHKERHTTPVFNLLKGQFSSVNMSPPYFSNEFNIYIRYLPTIRGLSKPGLVARSIPFSQTASTNETEEILKTIETFDLRLKKISYKKLENAVSVSSIGNYSLSNNQSKKMPSIVTVSELNSAESNLSLNAERHENNTYRTRKDSMTQSIISQKIYDSIAENIRVKENCLKGFIDPNGFAEGLSEEEAYFKFLRQFIFSKGCFKVKNEVIGTCESREKLSVKLICLKSIVQSSPPDIDLFNREIKKSIETNLQSGLGDGYLQIINLDISLTPLALDYILRLMVEQKPPLRQLLPYVPLKQIITNKVSLVNKLDIFIYSGNAAISFFKLENIILDYVRGEQKGYIHLNKPVVIKIMDIYMLEKLKTYLRALTSRKMFKSFAISPVKVMIHSSVENGDDKYLELPEFLIDLRKSIYCDLIVRCLEFLTDAISLEKKTHVTSLTNNDLSTKINFM